MMFHHAHRALASVTALTILLAACGDDDASSSGGAGGAGGTGGAGAGGEALCPTGSHATEAGCASELTAWVAGPSLDDARDHHVTWIAETDAGPFLYAAYGAGPLGVRTSIERAPIAADGSLEAFEDAGDVPAGRIGPGFAQDGRSFVIVGGLTGASNSDGASWVGAVDDAGAVSFVEGPPLVTSRYHVAAVLVNGYAFALGGLYQAIEGGAPTQEVLASIERAPFDGVTLGAWEEVGELPQARTHFAAFAHDGAIFVVGGGSALPAKTDILRATVGDDGALGAWEIVGELPEGRATSSTVLFLDQLYVIAGMKELTGMERDTVLRADLGADGLVGAFSELAPLPLARAHAHQTPLREGKLYSVGGSIDHVVQDEVFVGALE